MASKDEGAGCLIIVALVGGYFLIVKVVWPLVNAAWQWVRANTGTVWISLATIGLVVILCLVGRKIVRSQSRRRLFDGLHDAWLQGADAKLDAAEKFVAEDAEHMKNIDKRISALEKAVRGCH